MSVIRAFIAIDLSPEVCRKIGEVSAALKRQLPGNVLRWTAVSNVHLTLKFLGDVSTSNLDVLKEVMLREAARRPAFNLSSGGVAAFPSTSRPRVIWVGVQAPPELFALQHGLEDELARLGYAREEREFSPHLTLARVGRNATPKDIQQIGETLKHTGVGELGSTRVEEVHLFRSELRPEGSLYTCLFSAPLAK
jgi:2'-5' RNA ligase